MTLVYSWESKDSTTRTLNPEEVQADFDDKMYIQNKIYSRIHSDGWKIQGKVREDYYYWVDDFEAHHPLYGSVKGRFDGQIFATSKEGFNHFLKAHPYEEWDVQDI